MRTQVRKTIPLGEIIAAAFDEAAHHSNNPEEISHLATRAVNNMLRHARRGSSILRPARPLAR